MAIYIERDGYMLSPHHSSLLLPILAERGINAEPQDLLGIMVKIEDEPSGALRGTFFGRSKARREFRNLWRLRRWGLDAPAPVAFGEE